MLKILIVQYTGYISNKFIENGRKQNELKKYGDIRVVLNKNIKDRSYITIGDSINNFSKLIPNKLNDINKRIISPEELIYSNFKNLGDFRSYPELQIFGGVKIQDIQYIVLPKSYKNKSIVKKIRNMKIDIKWE